MKILRYKNFIYESTDDIFVNVRTYDKVKHPTKAYDDEDDEEEDIEIGEFDKKTPILYKQKEIFEPTDKHNSLGDGKTNYP